jgi:hypothetical protein
MLLTERLEEDNSKLVRQFPFRDNISGVLRKHSHANELHCRTCGHCQDV